MSDQTKGPSIKAPAATEAIAMVKSPPAKDTSLFGRAKYELQFLRGRGALEIGIVFVALQLIMVIYALIAPTKFPYLSSQNLSGVLTQDIPVLGILGIGVGVLMIAGEFDLSLGSALAFCAIMDIKVTNSTNWVIGLLAALAAGVLIALINGLIVVYTKIPSFIATLGMGFFWAGGTIFLNGPIPTTMSEKAAPVQLFVGDFGFFRAQVIWLILIGVVSWFLLHRHKVGNHLYAVGGNINAAKAISINPTKVKLFAFGFYGLLVGFAGVLIAVRTLSMQPNSTQDYTLLAVAAAVVGGVSLNGGRGSILGMVIGAALIKCINDALILINADGYYIQLFVGVIIVVASIINRKFEGSAR
jgi:simple sugar transport system permease protein